MLSSKAYALIDCNSFYCSCERVFRPDLQNKPIVVLSNNDGCAIARTSEAKTLGIEMGAPYFKIKKFCKKNKVSIFSSNFSLYTNLSNRVMSILIDACPEVEVYSIDEAFADLTGIQDLTKHGRYLRAKIIQDVGIPTGVGIAPTKVLAKIANHIAKKSEKSGGVVNLMERKLQDIALARVGVNDIWGIGRANTIKMKSLGIHTALDLRDFKNERLIQKIFTKVGLQIKQELMGIHCFPLNMDIEKKKEIMCSRTFGASVFDKDSLKESIANYISNASEKMRSQQSLCSQLSVFARTNPFKDVEQYFMYDRKKFSNPTCDTRKLIKSALQLIDKNYRNGYEYKKAGVKLSNFSHTQEYQIDFLSPADSEQDINLMHVIDKINLLEGENTVKFAACGTTNNSWQMNRRFKSPRYTNDWNELPKF